MNMSGLYGTANFTRPANTTPYASGDLVANSTTAGSVVPLEFTNLRNSKQMFWIRRAKLHKSGTSVTNSSFRVHFFREIPATITNGDNGAFSVSGVANYIGAIDIAIDRAFTDGAAGFGIPMTGTELIVKQSVHKPIYALIEARGAYTPASGEVFTLTLEDFEE
jgi:hypothetical protein